MPEGIASVSGWFTPAEKTRLLPPKDFQALQGALHQLRLAWHEEVPPPLHYLGAHIVTDRRISPDEIIWVERNSQFQGDES